MLGSLILYLQGMRTTMFQLSGFYCIGFGGFEVTGSRIWVSRFGIRVLSVELWELLWFRA